MLRYPNFSFSLAALIGLLAAISLATSCGTSQAVASQDKERKSNTLEVDNTKTGITDLTFYLKQISGVQVNGSGGDATITVRGVSSINSETSPLFVVNGNPIGNNYSVIFNMVDVQQVKRVRVLKSSVDTSLYGMRGATGVVEIEMN
ncbi:TonB-dependent receptor plug domain-containing protein [Neolewinella persica]|uniref:TonB-dependent receptor plug domain-containing protein n=1 Tax=Neolewinella persica TaxID=70998 RepID=UPI000363EF78|nr:TonB-dependent receptor plug domain-containing protein [Neolewinella persica]